MKKSLLLMTCLPCVLWAAMADDLIVERGYIRVNPPARATTAAYMTLDNAAETAIIITDVKASVAQKVQMHHTVMDHDVMHMDHMQTLEIPAKSSVELIPGGMHLMLLGVDEDMVAGKEAILTFTFQDGSQKKVTLPVQDIK